MCRLKFIQSNLGVNIEVADIKADIIKKMYNQNLIKQNDLYNLSEKEIMNRPPNKSNQGIFSDGLWSKIITEGIMIGMLTLVAFSIGNKYYSVEVGRTMAFVSIGILELVHSFNIKSEQSLFKVGILENKFLIGSFILGVFVQTIVVIVPELANIFKLVPLNQVQWIITLIISILPIPIMEVQKKVNEVKFGKTVFINENSKIEQN